ncbi:hypothetical protein [Deinococcus marmoris]|uniref:hypothetical protein n=1 Tax=Deinococcus marmoris TaxID=249408 RepID=UPI001115319F|nr:hypothetical protein [Deinococcus marmoris]
MSLDEIVKKGYMGALVCSPLLNRCIGRTPFAPNALASTLGLALPNRSGEMWDTAGQGWRVEVQQGGDWYAFLTPLGRNLTAQELRQYPEQTAPSRTTLPDTNVQNQKLSDSELSGTVIIDVRHLGKMEKSQKNIVYDNLGKKLWSVEMYLAYSRGRIQNDGDRVRFITPDQLKNYSLSDSSWLGPLRIKAMKLESDKGYMRIVLGPNSTRSFNNYIPAFRIVYLMENSQQIVNVAPSRSQNSDIAPAQSRASSAGSIPIAVPPRR